MKLTKNIVATFGVTIIVTKVGVGKLVCCGQDMELISEILETSFLFLRAFF